MDGFMHGWCMHGWCMHGWMDVCMSHTFLYIDGWMVAAWMVVSILCLSALSEFGSPTNVACILMYVCVSAGR